MNTINLITYCSILSEQANVSVEDTHKELLDALKSRFDVRIVKPDGLTALPSDGLNLVFVATGGTEGMIVRDFERLPKPLVLLTDGLANSLAASLELSNWARNQGADCQIVHGDIRTISDSVDRLVKRSLMKGKRIGVFGRPSDWLVASNVDYRSAMERWGVEYVDISLDEVNERFSSVTDSEAKSIAEEFSKKSERCIEPDSAEVLKAVRLYIAIRDVAKKYSLDALTIQCFSLIPTTKTTGCLALALLNDEGIVAGCEGDLQSIFTMLFVKTVTGQDTFMANPAFIDPSQNEIILAHCTIGLRQSEKYIIRSHFESKSGVAIQGVMQLGDVTIVKVGGLYLDRHAVLEGRITENQDDPRKCRTQIKVRLSDSSPATYFLTNSIGNHHIIFSGHWKDELEKVF